MSGPRIEAAVGEDLQTYSRRFDLWKRWEETVALSKIRPRQQEMVRVVRLEGSLPIQAYWRLEDISPNERESDKPSSLAIRAVVKNGLVLVLGWSER